MVMLASQKGVDILLTGDVSHHNALEAEYLGIALIDGGHFCTERTAFRNFAVPLKHALTSKGWESAVEVDDHEFNPMQDG